MACYVFIVKLPDGRTVERYSSTLYVGAKIGRKDGVWKVMEWLTENKEGNSEPFYHGAGFEEITTISTLEENIL